METVKRNESLGENLNFIILLSLQPDCVNLWYFKLFDQTTWTTLEFEIYKDFDIGLQWCWNLKIRVVYGKDSILLSKSYHDIAFCWDTLYTLSEIKLPLFLCNVLQTAEVISSLQICMTDAQRYTKKLKGRWGRYRHVEENYRGNFVDSLGPWEKIKKIKIFSKDFKLFSPRKINNLAVSCV